MQLSLEMLFSDTSPHPPGAWLRECSQPVGSGTPRPHLSLQVCHPEMEQLAFAFTSKPIRE